MKPLFIPGQAGPLFCIFYPPDNAAINRAIVHIPAFAEEMNKSRRMVALQAKAFASQGYAVLVPDLFGTGDSAGHFEEATWPIWLQDIDSAISWLKQQGAQSIDLWGLRTGALLAMNYATAPNRHKTDRLLCWQPVLNGDTFVTQFLRLRVAAAIMDNNAPKEKTADLKRQLLEGQAIEVAGYLLNPDLITPLMALRADQLSLHNVNDVALFEVVANEDSPVAMGNMQLFDKLQENAVEASITKVVGDAFWATQEITAAPDLITLTNRRVE
jgi:exosortase A-associated hydrolase 2